MTINVRFWSYFKDLAGGESLVVELPDASTVADLHQHLIERFPPLGGLRRSTLIAVGVDYARQETALRDGDEVSFFPPVQGG
jgi:molybdopterin synthase sulfur carrier subunit